ncbi:MAG: PIN domain-containing protein [Actinomycetota bacterium]
MYFVDTNVLVYAVDSTEPSKRAAANAFLMDASVRIVLSAQVLGEFYVTLRRRFSAEFTPAQVRRLTMSLANRVVLPIDAELASRAMRTVEEHRLSYWDALIVESAAEAGCDRLATEDLQSGAVIRGVEIWNPFADVA